MIQTIEDQIEKFIQAVDENDAEKAKELLKKGLDSNYMLGNGFRLLHFAAQSNAVNVASELINAGAIVECPLGNIGNNTTPLHMAAVSGGTETLELLLNSGANPLSGGTPENTPLALSRRNGFNEAAGILEKHATQCPQTDATIYTQSCTL